MSYANGILNFTSENTKIVVKGGGFNLTNKTLRSVHFAVVVVELMNCKCGGIVRNQIW